MKVYKLLTLMTAIVLAFTFRSLGVTPPVHTALEDLAASMQAGTWAQLTQTNINNVLGQGSVTGNQLPYANSIVWDSAQQRIHFVGSDHGASATNYMYYNASTNSWTFAGGTPLGLSHGYDHSTMDPNTGILYVREYGIGSDGNRIWQYPAGGPWSVRTSWNPTEYIQVALGTAWWTGPLGGAGANGALIVYNCGAPGGQVLAWDPRANTWFADITGFGGNSTYHCIAEYSAVHNTAIFGGGNENPRKVWRLNADRSVTAMAAAPIDLGVQHANATVDPVTGNFLIMGYGQFWEYDPRGAGLWTRQQGTRIPPSAVGNPASPNLDSVFSTAIPDYGVVTYITCRASTCNMYLYKHAASGSVPTPPPPPPPPPTPDTTVPTISLTAPSTGSTVSGTMAISGTASDNVGVTSVTVQIDSGSASTAAGTSNWTFSIDTHSLANGLHSASAQARDAAGNASTPAAVSFNVNNAPAPPPVTGDFQTLCSSGGVVKCVGFDSAADLTGTYGDNSGTLPGDATPQIDSSVKASGAGSLKFTIPSHSSANSSGSYFTNFSNNLSTQFGENSEFYVQWRQRFSPEFVAASYSGGGGWKQAIIGTGDKAGCSASNSANGQCYASCTALETVTQNLYHRGFPQMYNSCTGSASHGPYDPFEQAFGSYDFKLQNARPSPYCLYSQGQTNPASYLAPAGNCLGYVPNEWMTFQVHIKTGPRVNNEFTNSYVQLRVARDGQPAELALDWGPYNLAAGDAAANEKFGKVWLLPYNTGKDPSASYPVAYTWYDELIISTQPISMVSTPTPPPPPPPPADTTAPTVTNVVASSITTSSATVTWSTNEPADSQLEYGTTSSYGTQTTLAASLVTSHSQSLSGLTSGTLYNYRVRSRDGAGNLTLSPNFSFTTTAVAPPPPPPPPPPPAPAVELIGQWSFDEGAGGTAKDSSGQNNDGTLVNSPLWTKGRMGQALKFNASDNGNDSDDPRLVIGRTFDIPALPFTLSAWVNPVDFNDWRAIFSKRDSYSSSEMRFDTGLSQGTGRVYVTTGGTPLTFTYAPPKNTWTHLSIVATSADTKLYVNGVLKQKLGAITLGTKRTANTVIGSTGEGIGGDNDPFKGMIDDVRVHNRALSTTEVQQIFTIPSLTVFTYGADASDK